MKHLERKREVLEKLEGPQKSREKSSWRISIELFF